MKIKIENPSPKPICVVLEPWATEYIVNPKDHIVFESEGVLPEDAHFVVENHSSFIVIYPEWVGALVYAYASDGSRIN